MTIFPLAAHSQQKLNAHLQECDDFLNATISPENKPNADELRAALAPLPYADKVRLHRDLLAQYTRDAFENATRDEPEMANLKAMGKLLVFIAEGIPFGDERNIGDFDEDPEFIRLIGPKFQDSSDALMAELMSAKYLRLPLFSSHPGNVGEGYVFLLQAYVMAGYNSGRFNGQQTAPGAMIALPHESVESMLHGGNTLGLLAIVRAGADVITGFPGGIMNELPKKPLSKLDPTVLQTIVETLKARVDSANASQAVDAEASQEAPKNRPSMRR
ncbi:hypothetical protein [Hydrogenophaga sp. 2FB]|uniref:hypothetical protein n=1 Tax=Hydrogenophaga sp. 2FB TaxID=2502187 RepID=UPI0010F8CD69|nr:hypothetical protein [Hydrogenophaga sp. 2FB]